MSGGSFGYPRFKASDEIGRHNLRGMVDLLEEVGLGESRAARDLREVLAGLQKLDAILVGLEDVMNTLDRVPSGDETVEDIPPVVAEYERRAP